MNPKPHTTYRFHRLALSPLLSSTPLNSINKLKSKITGSDETDFINFISKNGLGPYLYEILSTNDKLDIFSPDSIKKLKNISLYTTAQYVRQQYTLNKVEEVFASNSIPHAVIKGAHTRELIYDNPAIRPACDIDILVTNTDKINAIKALVAADFTFSPDPKNISREANLTKGNATIDLHWDILRSGRTRIPMTNILLSTRRNYSTHWGLDDNATLFLMLVHPVFTEYATTTYSSIMRVVDMVKWMELRKPDWDKVIFLLKQASLQTAAWVMLEWLQMITECPIPLHVYKRLKPGILKTRYLRHWINKDYSTRLRQNPLIVQALFTLPVHDKLTDALRAVRSLIREKKSAEQNTKKLLSAISDQQPQITLHS